MSECNQHKVPMRLVDAGNGYTVERCEQCEEESHRLSQKVFDFQG
jgi:hypothetical protein